MCCVGSTEGLRSAVLRGR